MTQQLVHGSEVPERETGVPGIRMRVLHTDERGGTFGTGEFAPGAVLPRHLHTQADEILYISSGELMIEGRSCGPGTVLTVGAGTPHGPHSTINGCSIVFRFSAPLDMQMVD